MDETLIAVFIASSIRLGTPLLFASIGELVSERAGVLNMSVEGLMLSAAFVAAWVAHATGQPYAGLAAAIGAAATLAALLGLLSITLRANQIVVGLGFNLLALGATTLAARKVFGLRMQTHIPGLEKLNIPGLSDIPILGTALFQHISLVYIAVAFVAATWVLLKYTSFGLAVEAAGVDPRSAEKTGIPVVRTRYFAVMYMGLACGLGGSFFTIGDIHTFVEGITSGAGYLALAAVIFGNWRVGRTVGAALLFGAATAMQFQLPALGVDVPVALLVMLPYLAALIAVTGLMGRQTPPGALGLPFKLA